MPFSTTYANNILNWMFGKSNSLSSHSKVYIGLSSNDPEASNGTFSELSGNGYHRVLISQSGETYPDFISSATNRSITNPKQINWTKATADWPNAKGFGLFTGETGGQPYFYGALTDSNGNKTEIEVPTGAVALFDPNTLKISFPTTDISEAAATAE